MRPLCRRDEDTPRALALAMRGGADSHCPFLPAPGSLRQREQIEILHEAWRYGGVDYAAWSRGLRCSRKRNRLVLAFYVFEKFEGPSAIGAAKCKSEHLLIIISSSSNPAKMHQYCREKAQR
jgi:hypothetical protein